MLAYPVSHDPDMVVPGLNNSSSLRAPYLTSGGVHTEIYYFDLKYSLNQIHFIPFNQIYFILNGHTYFILTDQTFPTLTD